jgi:hypothetical protein
VEGIKEKIGALLTKDKKEKFENIVKNVLRRHNFSVVSKSDDWLYEIAIGTATFTVDVAELKNLYDLAKSDEEISVLSEKIESSFLTESKMISFTNAQTLLRLLIMRGDEVKDNYVVADFVGSLKKVVVYTPDDCDLNILSDVYVKRWGVPREVLFSVADRNMCRLLERAEITETVLNETKVLEFTLPNMELCVSTLICNDFRKTVYKYFGSKFLAVAPSRDSLLVLENVTNNILEGLGAAIIDEHGKSDKPLTTDVFLFTRNDIETAGHFSIGADGQ